ncbi:hypothetical protein HOD29_05170 [archaeon]|nr:hypothetical protein [archaeon]
MGRNFLSHKQNIPSIHEKKKSEFSKWRTWSWIAYMIGLPAWAIIFVIEHNWIAAALEVGGLPAMILGLIIATKKTKTKIRWLEAITLLAIIIGISYSIYDFHGLNTITQFLELGIVAGFLLGTYLLAKNKGVGYICFMVMNSSNIALMAIEGYPLLVVQQVISLLVVIYAYISRRNKIKLKISIN